jgi:peptidoglycan/xylan/chitin deacetylase (PgdA/CDA1 family)
VIQAIFTNDDAGGSPSPASVEHFRTVTHWLHGRGLRGTFFWVPCPANWRQAHELWRDALHEAIDLGHDFQLHGLAHDSCLEFGVPQPSTRRSNATPFEQYEGNLAYWQEQHSVEALTAKLQQGLEAYESVFGGRPRVFRAPCFGMGATAYEALHRLGVPYSSSRGVNPTMTAYTITGDVSLKRWTPDYPVQPWIEPPGVTEVPCMEDYTIAGVPEDQYDDRLALVQSEYGHLLADLGGEGVVVFASHYSAMAQTWPQTRRLLETTIDWLGELGVSEWVTFGKWAN